MQTGKFNNLIFTILGISLLLYFGKALFIPLSFSLLICFLLYPICAWLEKQGINRMLAIIICITFLSALILTVLVLLFQQILSFSGEWPQLKNKLLLTLDELSQFINVKFGFSKSAQELWFKNLVNDSSSGILSIINQVIYSSGVSLALAILIPFFAALMLFHRRELVSVMYSFFPKEKQNMIHEILLETVHTFYNFMKGMCIVYLVVGILNSLGLILLGIPHAILFGFIASVLTFIPYVGIMVASLLPITVAWITYDSFWYPMGVVMIFAFVQYLEANVIFPLAVSNRLKLNTLVTIIAIILGGILWGAAGMILFVPFIAIIKLIADRVPELHSLSLFMGGKEESKIKN